MAIYSAAQRISTFTINVGCWELRTTATDRPRIMEMGFFSEPPLPRPSALVALPQLALLLLVA